MQRTTLVIARALHDRCAVDIAALVADEVAATRTARDLWTYVYSLAEILQTYPVRRPGVDRLQVDCVFWRSAADAPTYARVCLHLGTGRVYAERQGCDGRE